MTNFFNFISAFSIIGLTASVSIAGGYPTLTFTCQPERHVMASDDTLKVIEAFKNLNFVNGTFAQISESAADVKFSGQSVSAEKLSESGPTLAHAMLFSGEVTAQKKKLTEKGPAYWDLGVPMMNDAVKMIKGDVNVTLNGSGPATVIQVGSASVAGYEKLSFQIDLGDHDQSWVTQAPGTTWYDGGHGSMFDAYVFEPDSKTFSEFLITYRCWTTGEN